jgi:hypothetical protein
VRGDSGATASLPAAPASSLPAPDDLQERIEALANDAPNQQDHDSGVQLAVQVVVGAANPIHALAVMERNVPAWWRAMRAGRARMKTLRYVVQDGDWIREPPEKQFRVYDPMDEVERKMGIDVKALAEAKKF